MRMALALAAVAVAPAATPDVAQLVLQPAQVAKGYVMRVQTGGKLVKGQLTLNLCGTGYASERFRTSRFQANYGKPNASTAVAISNEVVRYRSDGAALAMREVTRRAASCPHKPVDSGTPGVPKLTYRISRISDPHLLKGYLAIRVDVAAVIKGKRIESTSYAVYQQHGNVLSGVYSLGGSDAAQRALALHAAEQSARNLRRGGSGSIAGSGPTA
jgi:hypothetical protein